MGVGGQAGQRYTKRAQCAEGRGATAKSKSCGRSFVESATDGLRFIEIENERRNEGREGEGGNARSGDVEMKRRCCVALRCVALRSDRLFVRSFVRSFERLLACPPPPAPHTHTPTDVHRKKRAYPLAPLCVCVC